MFLLNISGGCREKAERRLTLQKEDTTFYHLFRLIKGFVSSALEEKNQTL